MSSESTGPYTLHQWLLARYVDHYAEHGHHAEHLDIELDERDFDDLIDMARALEAEAARLREVETAARELAAVTPRPKPYYGTPVWALDQALGETGEAAGPEYPGPCDCDECTAARNAVI